MGFGGVRARLRLEGKVTNGTCVLSWRRVHVRARARLFALVCSRSPVRMLALSLALFRCRSDPKGIGRSPLRSLRSILSIVARKPAAWSSSNGVFDARARQFRGTRPSVWFVIEKRPCGDCLLPCIGCALPHLRVCRLPVPFVSRVQRVPCP